MLLRRPAFGDRADMVRADGFRWRRPARPRLPPSPPLPPLPPPPPPPSPPPSPLLPSLNPLPRAAPPRTPSRGLLGRNGRHVTSLRPIWAGAGWLGGVDSDTVRAVSNTNDFKRRRSAGQMTGPSTRGSRLYAIDERTARRCPRVAASFGRGSFGRARSASIGRMPQRASRLG